MIVFGDPVTVVTLKEAISTLRQLQKSADPDTSRTLVIGCGQLEQAIADLADKDPTFATAKSAAEALTDNASDAFILETAPVVAGQLELLETLLLANLALTLKAPEGFQFYSLYPEQFAVTATRFAAAHTPESAFVIGLRSIGTTLSAVVNSALRHSGVRSRRITIRPGGHPFSREVSPADIKPENSEQIIVVDEGPGLSGSSMASVAAALQSLGVNLDQVTFFPAHDRGPGPNCPEWARDIWDKVKVHTTNAAELRWAGMSLKEKLLNSIELPVSERAELVYGGHGAWRRFAYPDEAAWPPLAPHFDRPKQIVVSEGRPAAVWEFHGLCPSWRDSNSEPSILGYRQMAWPAGRRCVPSDWDTGKGTLIFRTLEGTHGVMNQPEREASWNRLTEMLYWNLWESLGEDVANLVKTTFNQMELRQAARGTLRELAPWAWVLDATSQPTLASPFTPEMDHTVIGEQPWLWDLARLCVEWEVSPPESMEIFAVTWPDMHPLEPLFHLLAAAAFALGQFTLALSNSDESERPRLEKAIATRKGQIHGFLALLPKVQQGVPAGLQMALGKSA